MVFIHNFHFHFCLLLLKILFLAKQVPEIPLFEVFNKTENDITIRWSYSGSSLMSNSFKYKIQCGVYEDTRDIDIYSNQYQCQSLEDGSLYVITMHLVSVNNTIKRSRSTHAATCKLKLKLKLKR